MIALWPNVDWFSMRARYDLELFDSCAIFSDRCGRSGSFS